MLCRAEGLRRPKVLCGSGSTSGQICHPERAICDWKTENVCGERVVAINTNVYDYDLVSDWDPCL